MSIFYLKIISSGTTNSLLIEYVFRDFIMIPVYVNCNSIFVGSFLNEYYQVE
jgi:hypothetical protein